MNGIEMDKVDEVVIAGVKYIRKVEETKIEEVTTPEPQPVEEIQTGFPVVCSKCKKDTTVPFKPTEKWPVYCRDCYGERLKNGRG